MDTLVKDSGVTDSLPNTNVVWLDNETIDLCSFDKKHYRAGWYQVDIENESVQLNGNERRLTDDECAALGLSHTVPPTISAE